MNELVMMLMLGLLLLVPISFSVKDGKIWREEFVFIWCLLLVLILIISILQGMCK